MSDYPKKSYSNLWYNPPAGNAKFPQLGGAEKSTAVVRFSEVKCFEDQDSILLVGYAHDVSDVRWSQKAGGAKDWEFKPEIVSLRLYVNPSKRANDFSNFCGHFLFQCLSGSAAYQGKNLQDCVFKFDLKLNNCDEEDRRNLELSKDKWLSWYEDTMVNALKGRIFTAFEYVNKPKYLIDLVINPSDEKEGFVKSSQSSAVNSQSKADQLKEKWAFLNELMGTDNTFSGVITTLSKFSESDKDIALSLIDSIMKG